MTQRFANTKIEDMPDFRCPPPVGVLQVKVLGARGLMGVDLTFGGRTSDPYCSVTVGGCPQRTSSCPRTLEPDWSKDPPLVFLVYHERQNLVLQIFDENVLRQDIELAKMSTSRMRSVADLVSRCSFPRWIDLEAQVEGSAVQLRAVFSDLAPAPWGLPNSGTCVLALKLFHLRKVAAADAVGSKVRLRMGDVEIISKPCKAIDPGNVHGFGKRMSTQISHLLQKGVEVSTVAETFNLDPEVVEEVNRVQAKEHSWFGWDEAHYHLLPSDRMVQLEVQLGNSSSSSWSTSSTWLPLFLEAQPLEEVLSRCREAKTGHLQLPFAYGAEKGLVGVSLELFQGQDGLNHDG